MITYSQRVKNEKPLVLNKFIKEWTATQPIDSPKVAYVSYPRSGNTFLRALLEKAGV